MTTDTSESTITLFESRFSATKHYFIPSQAKLRFTMQFRKQKGLPCRQVMPQSLRSRFDDKNQRMLAIPARIRTVIYCSNAQFQAHKMAHF